MKGQTMFNRKALMQTTAVREVPNDQGGPEQYTPELFKEYECEQYRERFPTETAGLADSEIFNVVAATDDDQSDEDWKKLFQSSPRAIVANIDGDELAERARA